MSGKTTRDLKPSPIVVWAQQSQPCLEMCKRLAVALASKGHPVHLVGAVRDLEVHAQLATKEAASEETLNITGTEVPADARSVLEWARKFRQGVREIGALINTGLYEETGPRRQGSDNYEMHMLMNYVLPVAVTAGLGRALLRGKRARVVNVVTAAYKTDGVMWDDLQMEQGAYSPLAAVSQSQTALLTHAFVMQEVFDGSVTVGAVDAGRMMGAVLDVKGEESVLVDDAVEIAVWAATDPAATLPDGKLVNVAKEAHEPEDVDCVELDPARKLYHDTCTALGLPADPAAELDEGEDDSLFGALMCCGGAR